MRKYFMTAFILAGVLAIATSGLALEKVAAPMNADGRSDAWDAGSTCSVRYWNTCTGWVWVWGPWADGDVVGLVLEACCPQGGVLDATSEYCWTGSLPGYGYTGTVEISTDNGSGCPGALIAQQSFLPASGWNTQLWGENVSGNVVLTVTHTNVNAGVIPDVITWASDHPAVGPTGPAACGFCYPTTRNANSFYYGNTGTGTFCPGSPAYDGTCDSAWLWSGFFSCTISVEETSWGAVKNLYR